MSGGRSRRKAALPGAGYSRPVSLGASVLDAGDDVRDAFAEADRAMYRDKAFRRRSTDALEPAP